jgi:hypothetical protein
MFERLRPTIGLVLGFAVAACGGGDAPKAAAHPAAVASAPPEPQDACGAAIAKVVKSVKEPIQITAYVTGDKPAFVKVARALDVEMARIARLAPGSTTYRLVDPKTAALEAEARNDGVREGAFQDPDPDEDSSGILRGFAGVSLRYRAEHDAIVSLGADSIKSLDYVIAQKLRELVARGDQRRLRIGVISGKDELSLSAPDLVAASAAGGEAPSIAGILGKLPYYALEPIDLKGGAARIDPTLHAVIITQPGRDYTEAELRAIDAFLLQGDKGLFVIASAVNVAPGAGLSHVELATHGLERLLDGYGVELRREAILDWQNAPRVQVMSSSGPIAVTLPAIVEAIADPRVPGVERLFDRDFAAFAGVDRVALPFASPLVAHPEKQPRASFRVVARSSPRSTVVASSPLDLGLSTKLTPGGDAASRVIGLVVEGEVRGAFGAPAPRAPSRMFFLSSSQFAANPLARAAKPASGGGGDPELLALANPYAQSFLTSTIVAFRNTLDWLGHEDGLAACAPAR